MKIRPARKEDLMKMFKLINDAQSRKMMNREKTTFEEYLKERRAPGTFSLEAEENGEFVGFITMSRFKNQRKHIVSPTTCISKKYRGKGLGKKLLLAGIKKAKEDGAKKILYQCSATNIPSMKLAKSVGLKKVATLKKHDCIDGKYYDSLMFEKIL